MSAWRHPWRAWSALRAWADQRQAQRIPPSLWDAVLGELPFVAALPAAQQQRLRVLSARFLQSKQFHGAQGLVVTDAMALSIAVQACLPIMNLGLAAYGDFVGIVVHPHEVLATREVRDEAGVVHHYGEAVLGEAMRHGPVMLTWHEVSLAGLRAQEGRNLVIHEFVHQLDARNGQADGCPPLPRGFMGLGSRAALALWQQTLATAWERFRQQVALAERFGEPAPWLDSYGATAPAEFFAVACEAYFVNRPRFEQDFADLVRVFDALFRPGSERR